MHPFLFQIGGFRFPTYGFFSLLALAFIVWIVRRHARREGLDPGRTTEAIILTVAVGYFGARAFEIAINWERYAANPKLILFSTGVFLGGLISAIAFGIWWFRRVGLPYLKGLDLIALTAASVEAIGRWGCFFSGCCWGTPTDVSWAVTFPEIGRRLHRGLPTEPIHPTQIYMSLIGFAILGVLVLLYRRKRFDGQIIVAFVALYAAARFFVEFVRGDADRGFLFGGLLSTSQALGIPLALGAAAAYVHLSRRARVQAAA
jgi:phosphatidylglycerol:prolipoprotein diacylglycerol transferase